LIAKAEALASAPEMGVPMIERPGTRFFPTRSYLIIYRLNDKQQTVQILRFWHGARGKRPLL
jgi:plasmid stabilization system protein ParE